MGYYDVQDIHSYLQSLYELDTFIIHGWAKSIHVYVVMIAVVGKDHYSPKDQPVHDRHTDNEKC